MDGKTVLLFTLTLACGHAKTVKRGVEDNVPSIGAIVNCLGCTRDGGRKDLIVSRVRGVELLSAGVE